MDVKKLYIEWVDLETNTDRIVSEIIASGWKPDYIVGLVRGGLIPAVLVSHKLNVPMYALKVTFRNEQEFLESNLWMPMDAMEGKNILIVDDINDTGATLAWIRDDWTASVRGELKDGKSIGWNDRIRIAVMVNNDASPEKVDFAGLSIDKSREDQWVVYPWEPK